MQYGPVAWRLAAASLVVTAGLTAAPARADITPCIAGPGTCPPSISCNDDAECFGQGLGRCVGNSSGGGGTCSPDCNAAFSCNSVSDCPAFGALTANCRPTIAPGVPGICEYRDAGGRRLASLCVDTGTAVTATIIARCFSGGSWDAGDCDGDGVLNGVDANPCDGTATGTIEPLPSPFCLAGHICEGTTDVCAPLLRCSSTDDCLASADRIGATGPWECSAVPMSSVTFCHPSCDATAHCGDSADCAGLGTCRGVTSTLSMCLATPLSTCASGCSTNPLDWATGQGDCDGDGAQNGCDPNPCRAGDSPCLYNHVCSIDAGVVIPDASVATDGGVVTNDAGNVVDVDGGSTQDDAGSTEPFDAGGSAMDASGPIATTPGLGFGGGGGCRCGVAGGRARGDAGAYALLALGLGMLAARKRRRVTRR